MIKFLDMIRQYSNKPAFKVLDGDNTYTKTYKDFYDDMCGFAYGLEQKVGDLQNKKVGLYFESSYEYIMNICALLFKRAVVVPLNTRESTDNIRYMIENADIELLITDSEREASVGDIDGVKVINKECLSGEKKLGFEFVDFSDDEADNIVMLIYTSGTTGKHKAAMISAGNMFGHADAMYDSNAPFDSFEELKVYTNFPYYHRAGICLWVEHFEAGCCTYLSANLRNVLTDLEHESIDSAEVTPATIKLWSRLVKKGKFDGIGRTKLIVTGGAPIDIDTVEIYLNNGIGFGQYYGMTESALPFSRNFKVGELLKSVGHADPLIEVLIIEGEICVRSPGIMKGYYKNEEETKNSLEGEILHTGDLGYVDDDGYIYITGRKKNLIILSSGENVSPEELENFVYANPNVKECKAFEKNDRIVLSVYCDEAARDDIQAFIVKLNKTLPIFKRISRVEFKNEGLEKTFSGKIKRG